MPDTVDTPSLDALFLVLQEVLEPLGGKTIQDVLAYLVEGVFRAHAVSNLHQL